MFFKWSAHTKVFYPRLTRVSQLITFCFSVKSKDNQGECFSNGVRIQEYVIDIWKRIRRRVSQLITEKR